MTAFPTYEMILYDEIEGKPDEAVLEKIKAFFVSIFSNANTAKFDKKLNQASNIFTVLALLEKRIVGFKIGYQIEPGTFYSWVGGVDKSFRQRGIAAELMKRQHDWCARNDFQIVKTKTTNQFKSMLILNIKSGFDIIEVYSDINKERKIVLEKHLDKKQK